MTDGRRYIASFLLPGDFFGFSAGQVHRFSVEAIIAGTIVARYPRRRVEMLAESDAEVGRRVREAAFESIARLQMRMLLLARGNALEKVCAFLLEMADQSADAADVFDLPMSRYDIADYLAIAVETVSRALTMLRSRGAIAFLGTRRIKIIDRNALEEGGAASADTP
jgi:CRP-like cAMP-binding protein